MKSDREKSENQLLKNFTSLSILKASNFVLSWLIYPYIIRIVGVEYFGEIVLAQSIMLYFAIFTDYGFSLSAPREIARWHKANPRKCHFQISNFLFAQILLGCISFLTLILLTQNIPFFSKKGSLLLLSFMIVLGQNAMPVWVFQGIEKMEYLAWLNLIAKLLFVIGIWWMLQAPEDYIWVNFVWGTAHLFVGLLAWGILIARFGLKISWVSGKQIILTLRRDFHLFIANLTNVVIFNSSVIILGFFVDANTLGLYSIADRIFLFIRQLVVITHQTIYPRVTQLAERSVQEVQKFFLVFVRWVVILVLPACVLLLVIAPWIVYIFAEQYLSDTTNFVRILSFTVLLALLNIPAGQSLLVFGKERVYTQLSALAVVFHIIVSLGLAYFYQGYGVAWAMLFTECFLLGIFNFACYSQKLFSAS
ncbi:hypothetical protein BKI52_11680 [marine bacterium AO1-C]|nr:hypothetical protein BKI52_11680 [marine bacterium AO1-C]